jgi:hypothetical protein
VLLLSHHRSLRISHLFLARRPELLSTIFAEEPDCRVKGRLFKGYIVEDNTGADHCESVSALV